MPKPDDRLQMRTLTRQVFIASLLAASAPIQAAELRIRVADENDRPMWARLEVRGENGKCYQPGGALRDTTARNRPGGLPYYLESFIVKGEARLEAPSGTYTIVAEHGLEYERATRAVQLADKPVEARLRLRPWISMKKSDWWSGDMHVHRPIDDAATLALAEDLNITVLTTMWNKRNLWQGRGLPADPVLRASPEHLITLMNAEDERGGGAWMLHQIKHPLPLAVDGRWHPPGIHFVRTALAGRSKDQALPWFDCEKPVWWEVPVMMALATPDSFGVLHNHFNQYGIAASEAWGRPRDARRYPGRSGFVEYSLSLYYRYLNLGFRLPASAGSASGVLPNPVGYNRIYVEAPGPLSVVKWYSALRKGRSFVTNGPMLFLDAKEEGQEVAGTLEARAREPIGRVELVANGEVVRAFPLPADRTQFKSAFRLPLKQHSWVAARCFLKTEETVRLAHTSPVYLSGKWDARTDAAFFLQWIDELIAQTTSDAQRFANDAERQEILGLYREARKFYQR